MTIPQFQKTILDWYKKNKRNLPWRRTTDPYKILVSEIMLQQTQISRVIPKYKEFLKAFPNLKTLAKTPTKKLLKVWQGLGYWRRALYLKQIAQIIVRDYADKFPRDPEILETFPGIGHYTARAITCFAFGNPDAFIETNIRRVYLHFFFSKWSDLRNKRVGPSEQTLVRSERVGPLHRISDTSILKVAQKAVYKKDPRAWGWALMDYGSLVLKDKAINKRSKHYHKQSKFKGSLRSFRTKVVQLLLAQPQNQMSEKSLESFLKKELKASKKFYAPKYILHSLLRDGLMRKDNNFYFID